MLNSTEDSSVLMIIAGPAGSGKSTLCERLIAENNSIERVVTCTTRRPRENEVDGVDYFFLSDEEFDRRIEQDGFLEWAKVHANRYGTPKQQVIEKLKANVDLVMNIDVQGVAQFRKAALQEPLIAEKLVTVFIDPKNFDELIKRLRERGQDDEEEIARRIESARKEIQAKGEFDHVIETGTKEEDFAAILKIWQAEKTR